MPVSNFGSFALTRFLRASLYLVDELSAECSTLDWGPGRTRPGDPRAWGYVPFAIYRKEITLNGTDDSSDPGPSQLLTAALAGHDDA